MPTNTGYDWPALAAVTKSGSGDWTNLDVADNANAGSTVIDCDGKVSLEVMFDLYEDNSGTIDGPVTIYLLRDWDGTNFEGSQSGSFDATVLGGAVRFQVTPVQNKHLYQGFVLSVKDWSKLRIWILNESGQTLTTTFKYKLSDIPAAVA